jgi:hypothetical protein
MAGEFVISLPLFPVYHAPPASHRAKSTLDGRHRGSASAPEAPSKSIGSRYPKPFDDPCQDKTRRRLGRAAGLNQFGINLLELGLGTWP